MIRLQMVQPKDRDLLWNINQKYLYEMTKFYDDPMDEEGNYHYGHFDEYFTDPKRRVADTVISAVNRATTFFHVFISFVLSVYSNISDFVWICVILL